MLNLTHNCIEELKYLKYIKYILSFSFILLLSLIIFIRSIPSPISPELMALNFYELIINQNNIPLIEAGVSKEVVQKTLSHIISTLEQNIKTNLTFNENTLINNVQLQNLTIAYLSALNQLSATTCIVSHETSKQCSIRLSTNYLDHKAIDDTAVKKALKSIDISNYKDESLYFQDLTSLYIEELIKGYQSAKPSSEVNTRIFTFKLQNQLWLPIDYPYFLSSICTMISSPIN